MLSYHKVMRKSSQIVSFRLHGVVFPKMLWRSRRTDLVQTPGTARAATSARFNAVGPVPFGQGGIAIGNCGGVSRLLGGRQNTRFSILEPVSGGRVACPGICMANSDRLFHRCENSRIFWVFHLISFCLVSPPLQRILCRAAYFI